METVIKGALRTAVDDKDKFAAADRTKVTQAFQEGVANGFPNVTTQQVTITAMTVSRRLAGSRRLAPGNVKADYEIIIPEGARVPTTAEVQAASDAIKTHTNKALASKSLNVTITALTIEVQSITRREATPTDAPMTTTTPEEGEESNARYCAAIMPVATIVALIASASNIL